MHVLERSYFGWGRTAAHSASPRLGLVIHYDGPGSHLTQKSHDHCVKYWKSVRNYHRNDNGWLDIGYSFGVCPHADGKGEGYLFEGRGLGREQAAQPGGNTTYYSVTLMLGDGEHPTDVQIETVRELLEWLHDKTGNARKVKGHKDFISTSCPGSILYGMVKDGTFTKSPKKSPVSNKWPFEGNYALGLWDADRSATRKVQKKLNDLGYKPKLDVDGLYGPLTERAVKWFQKKKGLKADGLVGPKTWAALF